MWDGRSNRYTEPDKSVDTSILALNINIKIPTLGIITKIENNGWKMNKNLRPKSYQGKNKMFHNH